MDNLEFNAKSFLRYIVCLIMVFLVHISFITIFTLATTQNVGYDVYIPNAETNEYEKVYTHYYANGEDVKLKEYEEQGIKPETVVFRSNFEGAPYVACMIIAQIVSLAMFIIMVPSKLYKLGDADANKVTCGRAKKTLMRGVTLSAGALLVNIVSYVVLILAKLQFIGDIGVSIFKLANYHLFGYLQLIFQKANTADAIGWGAMVLALLPTVLTLASCFIAYVLGYKRINVYDKTVLQSKK